jgi:hypothetical protein
MLARREDLISVMTLLHTQTAGLFGLVRLLTVDYIRRHSSNEMDRGAWLRSQCKTDLVLKPAPRLLAEAVPSIALARIRIRKTCDGSVRAAGQARRAPATAPEFRFRLRATSAHSELPKEAADSISGMSLVPRPQ